METSYRLNVYEKNQITLYAVQGESESRIIHFTVIEKTGVVAPTSNAVVTDQPLDLTGYTAKMIATFSDGSTSVCDGTIDDPENGIVTFVLDSDFSIVPGRADCLIVFSENDTNLRAVGITLNVQSAVFERDELTVSKGTTFPIEVTVYNRDGSKYQLSSGEVLRFGVKKSVTDDECIITKDADASDRTTSGSYSVTIEPSDTVSMAAGRYRYGLSLISGNDVFPIVEDSLFNLTSAVVTGGAQ